MFSAFGRGDESLYEKLGYSRRRPGKYTQALTYPEEVSRANLDVGYTGYIPEDWKLALPKFSADIRDIRSFVITALVEISGKSLTEIESICGEFQGTQENWTAFANMMKTNIVFTELHMYRLVPSYILETKGSHSYLVVSSDSIPMVLANTRKYILTKSELPKVLIHWIQGEEPEEKKTENPKPKKEKTVAFSLEESNTIAKLNTLLETLYSTMFGNEQKHTFPTGKTLKKFQHGELYMMYSSGNNHDCLIHTIFTSILPNFRRLGQEEKDEFAHYFRRTIYPSMLVQLGLTSEKQDIASRRIRSTAYLLDEDIQYICNFYKINILIFEDEKHELVHSFNESVKKKVKQTKSIGMKTPIGNKSSQQHFTHVLIAKSS
jgi:hypothetical protein